MAYLQSYKIAPKGPKAPDSLYKLASALYKLNKKQESCATLTKLHDGFGKTGNWGTKSQEALQRASCPAPDNASPKAAPKKTTAAPAPEVEE